MSVAAQTDRRFRRAHVKPSRRRRSWRALAVPMLIWSAGAAALAYGVLRVSASAAHAQVLQIETITVHGNERMSKGEVLAVLTGLRGESLVWTDLDAWRRRLMASPWVRDAALRRSLPSTIDVVVSERQPIGIGRINGDPAMIQLGEDQFLTRLQSYIDLAPTLRERVADIDYVDLRFDDRIFVRPTKTGKKKQ